MDWKVTVAGYMKLKRVCRNGWLADRLDMGSDSGVSRYVSQMQSGERVRRKSPYPHTSIRVGDYKLVKFWRKDKMLLFNLKIDLGETKDLAKAQPKKTLQLHKQLMDYLESVDSDVLTLYN